MLCVFSKAAFPFSSSFAAAAAVICGLRLFLLCLVVLKNMEKNKKNQPMDTPKDDLPEQQNGLLDGFTSDNMKNSSLNRIQNRSKSKKEVVAAQDCSSTINGNFFIDADMLAQQLAAAVYEEAGDKLSDVSTIL